jgi:putative transposase
LVSVFVLFFVLSFVLVIMTYYERRLPHWQPEDAWLFVTWRLYGTLPAWRIPAAGEDAGRAFAAFDAALASDTAGPRWLEEPRVAQCMIDTLSHCEATLRLYSLHAWVLMPNHVHILIDPHAPLARIMKSVKGYSARQANRILGRDSESFWQAESYDRWVRDEDACNKVVRYIERNPVAAGLVERPDDWRWSSAFRVG